MAYELMSREDYEISYAIGSDLTDWRNGGVKLAVAELNACDWFHSGSILHTKPKYMKANPGTSAGHYPRRITAGVNRGKFFPTFYLQTGIFTYAIMGTSADTDATPNTHRITKKTTETPISLAFQVEKGGTTHGRFKSIMGMVPRGIDIYCNEQQTVALQTPQWEFAQTVAGDDLAQPTALTQAAHAPYTWFHYKDGSGTSKFEYNSDAIDAAIVGFNIHLGWTGSYFGEYNGSAFPTQGLVNPPFTPAIDLDLRIKDNDNAQIDTISDLDHESYAGDLNLFIDFYESANRYLVYKFTDMFIEPDYEEKFQSEGDWYDGIKIRLTPRNETTTTEVDENNALTDDHYTNP